MKVLTGGGLQLGFVPEEDAMELAPLFDAGHPYPARIKKILNGSSHDVPVVIADFYSMGAPAPDLVLPYQSPKEPQAVLESALPRSSFDAMMTVAIVIAVVVVAFTVRDCVS